MVLNQVDKAAAHVKEATQWVKESDELIVKVHQLCHEQSVGQRQPGDGGGVSGGASKPLNELKPDKLCHDSDRHNSARGVTNSMPM